MVQQHLQHGRHQHQVGHAVPLHLIQDGFGSEGRNDDEGIAADSLPDQPAGSADMEQRGGDQRNAARLAAHLGHAGD